LRNLAAAAGRQQTEEATMATMQLTKDNFEQEVLGNDIAVIDFWAPWCGPCKSFGPTFEAVSDQHEDVLFAKVNTEDEQELAAHFNIRSIPTLMIIRDKVIVFTQAGALPKPALEDVVSQAKALDMDMVRAEIAKQSADA
jgi:thioredoxin